MGPGMGAYELRDFIFGKSSKTLKSVLYTQHTQNGNTELEVLGPWGERGRGGQNRLTESSPNRRPPEFPSHNGRLESNSTRFQVPKDPELVEKVVIFDFAFADVVSIGM